MPSLSDLDSYFSSRYRPEVRFFQDVHRESEQMQEVLGNRREY